MRLGTTALSIVLYYFFRLLYCATLIRVPVHTGTLCAKRTATTNGILYTNRSRKLEENEEQKRVRWCECVCRVRRNVYDSLPYVAVITNYSTSYCARRVFFLLPHNCRHFSNNEHNSPLSRDYEHIRCCYRCIDHTLSLSLSLLFVLCYIENKSYSFYHDGIVLADGFLCVQQ